MNIRAIPASLEATAPMESNGPFRRSMFFWIVLLLILLLCAGIYALRFELRSYVFLNQFLDPHASGLFIRLEGHDLDIHEVTLSTTQGPVRGRLYTLRGIAHPPGMVLIHGIQNQLLGCSSGSALAR